MRKTGGTIILSDNLPVLKAMEAGRVDLIYVDPPFNTGRTQSRTRIRVERDEADPINVFGLVPDPEVFEAALELFSESLEIPLTLLPIAIISPVHRHMEHRRRQVPGVGITVRETGDTRPRDRRP